MDITTLDFKRFSDRINYLANIFGDKELAFYLGVDDKDVAMWSNSMTLIEAPAHINYTYFTAKYPQFRSEWLENGEGEIFKTGSVEENEKLIRACESKKKVDEAIDVMERGMS